MQVLFILCVVRAERPDARLLATSNSVAGCVDYCFFIFNSIIRTNINSAILFLDISDLFTWYLKNWALDSCLGRWNMRRNFVQCTTFVEHVVTEKCWIVLIISHLLRYLLQLFYHRFYSNGDYWWFLNLYKLFLSFICRLL